MRTSTGILAAALAAMFLTSCSEETGDDESSVPAQFSSDFSYPPVYQLWDIAAEIPDPEREVATFAVETVVLEYRLNSEPELAHEYDARVSEDFYKAFSRTTGEKVSTFSRDKHESKPMDYPTTGGVTYRVVSVTPEGESWRATICKYDTPGVYRQFDGELTLEAPGARYTAYQVDVSRTTDKSQAGDTPGSPRLLLTADHSSVFDSMDYPDTAYALRTSTCEPYLPQPFIQQPPPRNPGDG